MKGRITLKNRKHKIKYVMLALCIIVFILGISYIAYYFYSTNKAKQAYKNLLNNTQIDVADITEQQTERMLQVVELQKENVDIKGWLEITDTNINYPILQGTDNDYYLDHNYQKEKSSTGSLFLDKDYDFTKPSSNLLIYGHRNKKGLMFEDLLKYKDESFYKEHPVIRFTTDTEDVEYEILAVFYSRVYYKSEQNVFRYYYFINAENEEEYNNYVAESKKASIYDTGVTAEYGEQLLTLSTCEYSQEDGRFVVVAKELKH